MRQNLTALGGVFAAFSVFALAGTASATGSAEGMTPRSSMAVATPARGSQAAVEVSATRHDGVLLAQYYGGGGYGGGYSGNDYNYQQQQYHQPRYYHKKYYRPRYYAPKSYNSY